MAKIYNEVLGILAKKGFTEAIQIYFKSKLLPTEDEELDASTELGKVKKLTKMKKVM